MMFGKEITIQKIIEDSTTLNNGNGLIVPIGVNSDSKIEYVDYSKINNLLVCGTTGSGKTTFVRTLIASLISTHKPDSVKLCIFDSRRTDYIEFSNIPHLMVPIITDTQKSCGMISWVLGEAQKRLCLLNEETVEFNVPEIYVVLDDYAQIAQEPGLQERLCELLQIAHRVKIHVVIVTSIALARIISTELKVHIPHRVAFFLPEKRNSQVVIDQNGAETLEMPGEFIAKFYSKSKTYHSIELTDSEIIKACNLYKSEMVYDDDVMIETEAQACNSGRISFSNSVSTNKFDDTLYDKVVDIAIEAGMVSTTLLQRKLKLGYAQAAKLVDELEENGVVGPRDGAKPRKVLITKK